MKTVYLVIIATLVSILIPPLHYSSAIPLRSAPDLYNAAQVILYGEVVSKHLGPSPKTAYIDVKIMDYYKNPKQFAMMTLQEPTETNPRVGNVVFGPGDRGLFYLNQINESYFISPYSIRVPEGCDGRQMLGVPVLPGQPFHGFPAGPINDSGRCSSPYQHWPDKHESLQRPLDQQRSGVLPNHVTCRENLQLVIKEQDGSPACVTPSTAMSLLERGWARGETAWPQGGMNYEAGTNSTIIPGHMPRGSCGVALPYFYSARITNYTGFAGVYPTMFMGWGKQDDYVLVPGTAGTITYELNASLSNTIPPFVPPEVPGFLEMTNYAIFYHEVTSLADLAKYPGVTPNDKHDFKACLVRPTGYILCIGGDQNGTGQIEAYVVDHPGVHVLFEPISEAFQPESKAQLPSIVTMMISVDKGAARGTYHVVLSPECGGVSFLLTVGDKPYHK